MGRVIFDGLARTRERLMAYCPGESDIGGGLHFNSLTCNLKIDGSWIQISSLSDLDKQPFLEQKKRRSTSVLAEKSL